MNKKQQGVLILWEIIRFRGCSHLVVNILMQTTDVGYCTQSHKQCLMMSTACRWHDSSRQLLSFELHLLWLKPIIQRISRNVSGSEIRFDAKHNLFPNLKKWLYYLNPTLKYSHNAKTWRNRLSLKPCWWEWNIGSLCLIQVTQAVHLNITKSTADITK